jgi:hypothetical protein
MYKMQFSIASYLQSACAAPVRYEDFETGFLRGSSSS